jgi:hypothetical protein
VRSPLRTERKRYARPSRELLPYRSTLGADVQRAVVVSGPVDGAEAAVRLGERAAGSLHGVTFEGGDDAGGVFGFLSLSFLACAGGGFACSLGFCFGLPELFFCVFEFGGALCGGFLGLLFFVFFGPLFGDGAFGGFVAALVGPGEFWGSVVFCDLASFGGRPGWDFRNGEFAGPYGSTGCAVCFDPKAVSAAGFKAGQLEGDRVLFVVGGEGTFGVLAARQTGAVQADFPCGFVTLGVDLRFHKPFSGRSSPKAYGSDEGRYSFARQRWGRRDRERSEDRDGEHQAEGAAGVLRGVRGLSAHDPELRNHSGCCGWAIRPGLAGVSPGRLNIVWCRDSVGAAPRTP